MPFATTLYEDRLGATNAFGPHLFILACLGDRLEMDHWELREDFQGVPRNGMGVLLRDLRERHERFRRDGRALVALIDGDRLAEHLRDPDGNPMPRTATDEQLIAAIYPSEAPAGVRIFILRDNTETLLFAVARCGGVHGLPVRPGRLDRKSRTVRDAVLLRAANDGNRALRDCVLAEVPAIRALVEHLEHLVVGQSGT